MSSSKGFRNNQIKTRNKIEQDEHCDDAFARRTKLVDEMGEAVNSANPIPVEGNLTVTPQPQPETIPNQGLVNLQAAGDIESFIIPANTVSFEVYLRSADDSYVEFEYAWNEIDFSNNIFRTVDSGNSLLLSNIYRNASRTIYFRSSSDNTVLEVETFSEA